jgi:hypothetical protein
MNRKISILFLIIMAAGALLVSCGRNDETGPVYVRSANASYRVQTITRDPETRMTITVVGEKADMEDMQNTFFTEGAHARVSAGADTIDCGEIVYGTADTGESPDILATLVFEVPTDFPDSFSLHANGADAVLLEYSPPAGDK